MSLLKTVYPRQSNTTRSILWTINGTQRLRAVKINNWSENDKQLSLMNFQNGLGIYFLFMKAFP